MKLILFFMMSFLTQYAVFSQETPERIRIASVYAEGNLGYGLQSEDFNSPQILGLKLGINSRNGFFEFGGAGGYMKWNGFDAMGLDLHMNLFFFEKFYLGTGVNTLLKPSFDSDIEFTYLGQSQIGYTFKLGEGDYMNSRIQINLPFERSTGLYGLSISLIYGLAYF